MKINLGKIFLGKRRNFESNIDRSRLVGDLLSSSGVYLKLAKTFKLEDWHIEAARIMAQSGCSLETAITELGIPLTHKEGQVLLRKEFFQRLLWEEKHRYFARLGTDPNFKKDTAIGKLLDLSRKLEDTGEFDKAADVIYKIARMTGWVGPESTVNVFGELSDKDLQEIREKVQKGTSKEILN